MNEPPLRLSNDPNSDDFHPSLLRVGIKIDGVERNDISFYDVKTGMYKTNKMADRETPNLAMSIEPFWRYEETRQQRRQRERWEAKHGS